MKYNYKAMTEEEKILASVKELNATSIETAVTMEQIIEKGISLQLTDDYFRENWHGFRDGDHPWYPIVAPMMGIGPEESVAAKEELYLHRRKVQRDGDDKKSSVMVYWYDPSTMHKVVDKSGKAVMKKEIKPVIEGKTIVLTDEQKAAKASQEPSKYTLVAGKLLSTEWIRNNPEKFKQLYGNAQ